MVKAFRILFYLIVFWMILFIGFEWWNSFPKVKLTTVTGLKSENPGADSILNNSLNNFRLPGLSVAIVKNGKLIYQHAVGYKNLEKKDSLLVDSKILVASVSKIFTAMVAAEVFHSQGIAPQHSLQDISPHFSGAVGSVSLNELLTHRSGIRDKSLTQKLFTFSKNNRLDLWGEEFIENSTSEEFVNKEFQYADANFDLLGYGLSQLKKEPFEAIVANNLFKRSGMSDSEFIHTWPMGTNNLTGYQHTVIWKRLEAKRIKFSVLPSPSTGLLTTTRDMGKALIHLLRGNRGIFQDHIHWLKSSSDGDLLGFQSIIVNGHSWQGHYGGQAGYSSMLFFSTSADMGIFIFANSKDHSDFRIKIASELINYFSN